MAEFNRGDNVRLRYGATCKILRKLGEGGQGIVYEVEYKGKPMALKWYFGAKLRNPKAFYEHLEDNIALGAPSNAFLWPQELTEVQDGSFGYIMELRPPEYEDFQKFLLAQVRFASVEALLHAGLEIVAGFRELHSRGYGYQDLNDGNFFINPKTGDVLICDNDNVAPYGENLGIAGKCRYMAPEIVLRKKNPDVNTDKFSLAVVLFLLLFMNHPLEGKNTMRPCMTEELEHRFYGTDPVFIFDPTDDSNRPVKGIHTNAIRRWPIYPSYVREMFVRAFTKDSMAGRTPRVIEKEWQEMFTKMRDELVLCDQCGGETFLNGKGPCSCINCGAQVRAAYLLKTPNYDVPLARGKNLYACHTDGSSEDFRTVTAKIQTKKDDRTMVRLKNMSPLSWICMDAQGNQAVIKPGEAVLASEQMSINIGDTTLKVE